jgi:hypothetical protein
MAIVRNVSTAAFLKGLLGSPSSYSSAFVGLQRNSSGIWVWNDGQVCNWTLSTDERCNGNCQFDGSGAYEVFVLEPLFSNTTRMNDITDTNDGSVLCEVKCKYSFNQQHFDFADHFKLFFSILLFPFNVSEVVNLFRHSMWSL